MGILEELEEAENNFYYVLEAYRDGVANKEELNLAREELQKVEDVFMRFIGEEEEEIEEKTCHLTLVPKPDMCCNGSVEEVTQCMGEGGICPLKG